jgi:hypothetical protein
MLSNEVKLNRTIAELEKARAYDQWRDWRLAQHKQNNKPPSIQECLSEAESILNKATRTITKHNGAGDNRTVFTESTWPEYRESVGSIDESADAGNPRVLQIKNYMTACNITEAEARQVLGLHPAGLSRRQAVEFRLLVSCGLSRAEAEKRAKQN